MKISLYTIALFSLLIQSQANQKFKTYEDLADVIKNAHSPGQPDLEGLALPKETSPENGKTLPDVKITPPTYSETNVPNLKSLPKTEVKKPV